MKNHQMNQVNMQNHAIRKLVSHDRATTDSFIQTAKEILAEIVRFRRTPSRGKSCGFLDCEKCSSWHLPKIISCVKYHKPVTFVLPAFPGKSPNTEKVLSHLPDQAEFLSLKFLGNLCKKIKKYYSPGTKIILCSDGRVFSDVVGMKESNVTAYQVELGRLIKVMSLTDISTFNLDDHYHDLNFVQMREELMKRYGKSAEVLKYKVRGGAKTTASPDEQEANRMYRGITRFLFEDAQHVEQAKSRTAVQKEARVNAYEVIRRSNAWSELISEKFPKAVRLSIHPQTCGAKKLGIRLIADERWMTPWHGVAVVTKGGPILLKRSEAEALGARLVYSANERPSHYELTADQNVSTAEEVK